VGLKGIVRLIEVNKEGEKIIITEFPPYDFGDIGKQMEKPVEKPREKSGVVVREKLRWGKIGQ
jgi:hypothetical protein